MHACMQVRQQVLELQALREELGDAQSRLGALKRATEGSKVAAAQQVGSCFYLVG